MNRGFTGRGLLYALIILQIFSISGCAQASKQETPFPSESTIASSVPSPKAEDTTTPHISVIPEQSIEPSPECTQVPLSYDEYFKEERGFHDQAWNPIFDKLHVFIYTKGGWHWETDGLTLGYLYAYDFNTKEFSLLAEETVSCSWFVNERIYYSAKDTIYSLDSTGKDRKVEFTADGDITKFVANDILIYYVVDDNLYRSYRPSGTTDYISSVPGISALYPLTNKKLAWIADHEDVIVDNPEVDGNENISSEYIIDVDAKTTSELPGDEWNEIVTSQLEENMEYFSPASNNSALSSSNISPMTSYGSIPVPHTILWGYILDNKWNCMCKS